MTQASDAIPNSSRKMVMRRDSAGWYEPLAGEGVDEGVDENSRPQSDVSFEWPASDDSQSQSPGPLSPQSSSPRSLEDKGSQNYNSPLENEHTTGTLSHDSDAAPQQLKTMARREEITCIPQVQSMTDSHVAKGKPSSDPSTPHTLNSATMSESSSGTISTLPRSIPGLMEYFSRYYLSLKSQTSAYCTLVDPTVSMRWLQTHCRGDRSASTISSSPMRPWLVAMLLVTTFLVFIPWARPLKDIRFASPTCAETMNPGDSMLSIVEVGDDTLWAMIHASRMNSLPAAQYTRNAM